MAMIYGLACHISDKVYVGCTQNQAKRFREHRCLLRNGKHFEPEMQLDWDRYGEGQFYIFTIQDLPNATVDEKREAELGWMDKYGKRLYNSRRISFNAASETIRKWSQAGVNARKGRPQSQESNEKRRLAQLGIPKGHGAKISATKRQKRIDEIV